MRYSSEFDSAIIEQRRLKRQEDDAKLGRIRDAAPELLEACQAALVLLNTEEDKLLCNESLEDENVLFAARGMLKAAIAKATNPV